MFPSFDEQLGKTRKVGRGVLRPTRDAMFPRAPMDRSRGHQRFLHLLFVNPSVYYVTFLHFPKIVLVQPDYPGV